jgi:hypothetical protein
MAVLALCATALAAQTARGGSGPTPRQTNTPLLDPVRLERAHRRLVRSSAALEGGVTLSQLLALVLVPENSGVASSTEDHRAALFVAAFFVNQWPIDRLVPEAQAWPRPTPRRVTLGGRRDHAQHFSLSAAMAAAVGTPMAEAVAVFKELRDAQGGSGFSFSDVLANRAGQRFGSLAASSTQTAGQLLERLRKPLSDRDIMPTIDGLPDNLTQQEFTRRFGEVGSVAYNTLVADIDGRIGALALYR